MLYWYKYQYFQIFLLQYSPLLKLAVHIMEKIKAEGHILLTSKDNLKISFIKELYNLGIYYGHDRDSFENRPCQDNLDFCGYYRFLKNIVLRLNQPFFYAQKYFTAFPIFINQQNNINFVDACYTVCFVAGNNNDNSSLF